MWKSAISVHAYNLSTWKTEEAVCEFEGSLDYRAKPCLKKQKNKTKY